MIFSSEHFQIFSTLKIEFSFQNEGLLPIQINYLSKYDTKFQRDAKQDRNTSYLFYV